MKKKIVTESYLYEVIDSLGQVVEKDEDLNTLLKRLQDDYSREEILTFKGRQMVVKTIRYATKSTGITFNFQNMSEASDAEG